MTSREFVTDRSGTEFSNFDVYSFDDAGLEFVAFRTLKYLDTDNTTALAVLHAFRSIFDVTSFLAEK